MLVNNAFLKMGTCRNEELRVQKCMKMHKNNNNESFEFEAQGLFLALKLIIILTNPLPNTVGAASQCY